MTVIVDGEYKYAFAEEGKPEARGGTELLTEKLASVVDKELLEKFWIVSSRIPDAEKYPMPEDKIRVFWAHDLAGDPNSDFLKDPNKANQFHKFVFVSNWQMQSYIARYNLPWDKCVVLQNAIMPIDVKEKADTQEEIRLIYHSTPRRGLNVLTAVFDELCKHFDNLRLDVYSSHALYGWPEADEPYKEVFDRLAENPKVHVHGSVSNDEIREALSKAHIFAYPSTYVETSCLCLMEAMSAGCVAVHSNLGALYETSSNWTQMYQYNPDDSQHAQVFYNVMAGVIENINLMLPRTQSAKSYADVFYNWETRKLEWTAMLNSLVSTVKDTSIPKAMFTLKT